jgi:hypothetical protein
MFMSCHQNAGQCNIETKLLSFCGGDFSDCGLLACETM